MNDVGGCDSGTGLRAGKSSRSSADANFEPYDDSEWDVGIGNLIIDLDADIEKNTEQQSVGSNRLITSPASSTSSGSSPTPNQMHIPSNAAPSNSSSTGISAASSGGSSSTTGGNKIASSKTSSSPSSGVSTKHGGGTADMEHSAVVDKGLKMKIKRKAGTKSGGEAKHEIVKNDSLLASNLNNSKNSSSDSSSSGKSAHHHSSSSSSSKNNSASNSENDSHGVANNNGVNNKDSSLNSNNDLSVGGGSSKKTSNRKSSKDSKDGGRGESNSKKVKNTGGGGSGGGGTKNSKSDANNSSTNSEMNTNKSHHGKESLSSTTATVSLNVPTIVPGGSSAFGKVNSSSTLKVPLSNSTISGSSNSSVQQQHSSSSDSPSSRTSLNSGNNNNSSGGSGSSTNSHLSSSWNSSSPSKGGVVDGTKSLLDKVQNNTNNSSSTSSSSSGSLSYSNKKGRNSFSNSSEKIGAVETDGLNSSSGGSHFNNSVSRSSSVSSAASVADLSSGGGGGGGGVSSVNHHQSISMSHHQQHQQSLNAKGRPSTQDVCIGTSVGTVTEPDCLGPCEPGTSVTLEGIVWHETESGVLVVNVTWRGKTYVGTLLDCTKSEWAPPRFCDSPTSDLEMRLPKNRGKRGGRGQQSTPVNELTSASDAAAALLLQQGLGTGGSVGLGGAGNGGNGRPGQNPKLRNGAKGRRGSAATTGTSAAAAAASFITPASPMKGQNNSNSDSSLPKRKTRGSENESATDDAPVSTSKNAKRPKLSTKDKTPGSPSSTLDGDSKSGPSSPALIECPEPNCSKKYKHINGLRYHQSHAHCVVAEDSDSNASTTSNAKETLTNNSDALGGASGSLPSTNSSNISALVIESELESMDTTTNSETTPTAVIASSGDINASEMDRSEEPSLLKTPSSNKNSSGGNILGKNNKEGEIESKIESPSVSRAPILTVPVPYISLQGRNAMSGGDVMKSVGSSLSVKGGLGQQQSSSSSTSGGGISWQPHHHGAQSQQQPGGGGGSLIGAGGNSSMVSLNIPMSSESKSKDKNNGDGKKTKHKKSKKDKEKMKQTGDSGSPSKNEGSANNNAGRVISTPGGLFGSPSVQRDSVSSEDNEVRMVVGSGNNAGGDGGPGGGRLGVLEDPQSPAYSDISDANDSGDAVELTSGVKDHNKSPPDLMQQQKKDNLHVPLHGHPPQAPVSQQHQPQSQLGHPQQQPGLHGNAPPPGMSPFYPAFYNPYANLEPPNSNKMGVDLNKGDDGGLEKGGANNKISSGQQPPGVHKTPTPQQQQQQQPGGQASTGDIDRGRSPKLDFHHPKYLPQQHFFHYPYSNYHFDGGQYGGMMPGGNGGPPDGPGNTFNPHVRGVPPGGGGPPFGMMDQEKDKDQLDKEKDGGGTPLGLNIKQEPGEKMLHKDQVSGRHSSSHLKPSEMMEKDRMNLMSDIKTEYGMNPSDFSSGGKPGHFGSIACSKHGGISSSGKDSGKREESSKNQSDSSKKENDEKDRKESEGKGPTMETTGPPPPPTAGSFAYLPQPYNPFGLPFDTGHPLYRQVIVPGPFGGPPYMHPHAGGMPRFQPPPPPQGPPGNGGGGPPGGMPEDLSRASSGGVNPGGPSPGGPTAKALDMLQHHAQYYQVHKIHELSERALKSPSPQVVQQRERPDRSEAPTAPPQPPSQPQSSSSSSAIPTAASPGGGSSSRNLSKLGVADLSNKDQSKISVGSVNESSRSPPTQHHVHSHTHHHTHVGIGYPIIPAFPAPHSPHYGVIPTAPPTAASVIPPFPTPKPN